MKSDQCADRPGFSDDEYYGCFFGSAESIQNEQYFNILQRVDDENDFLTLGVFNLEGNGLISDRDAKKVYDYKVSEMKDEARSVIEKALQGKESMSDEYVGALTEKML